MFLQVSKPQPSFASLSGLGQPAFGFQFWWIGKIYRNANAVNAVNAVNTVNAVNAVG